MQKVILDFLNAMVGLIGNKFYEHDVDMDFVIVVWDHDGVHYVGGRTDSPALTIDMLHRAAHVVKTLHVREEGRA